MKCLRSDAVAPLSRPLCRPIIRIQISCRRAAARVCPAPLLPRGHRSAFRRRADGNVAAVSHGQHVLAHRCSRLTRQHVGEQSGLVTLTFDFLTLKVVSKSHVAWATSVPILVFLSLSVLNLGPMYATDVRQKHRLMPRLLGAGA